MLDFSLKSATYDASFTPTLSSQGLEAEQPNNSDGSPSPGKAARRGSTDQTAPVLQDNQTQEWVAQHADWSSEKAVTVGTGVLEKEVVVDSNSNMAAAEQVIKSVKLDWIY